MKILELLIRNESDYHGRTWGAGTIVPGDITTELESAYLQSLKGALYAGYPVLEEDWLTMNVVNVMMEDNVLLNAERGAVFTKMTFRKSMLPS